MSTIRFALENTRCVYICVVCILITECMCIWCSVVYVYMCMYSLVVETFNLEKNGREAYFIPLKTPFFIEKHIQNPLESPVGKSFYGCPRFCVIPITPIIMTNHFCHRNYTVAAANDLS